jgi:hypothetical protein
MPKRTSYAQGTPSWVDLQTTDQEGAKTYYAAVLGWQYDDQAMEQGVYSMALKSGETVAGIAPQPPMLASQGVPPAWNSYLAVDSVDQALERATKAGGQVLMPAMDVWESGRMAFVADPTGAAVGLWQAKNHIGATLVNEPGTLVWNELLTSDESAAVGFYGDVFGLTAKSTDMGGRSYTMFHVGDDAVGGTTAPPMAGVPNHWHVYFGVDDADATIEKSNAAGGAVIVGAFDMPIGRMATLSDPQGAAFSIIALRS